MDQKIQQRWEEFLNPDVLRPRLISAAIYIAAFESLKDSIVARARDFYWHGIDESGDKISPEYQSKVLAKNKSLVFASLDWLKSEMKVIDDSDIATFERIKACRNHLSHKLFSILGTEGLPPNLDDCFNEMVALLHKIDLWWIVNIEIPTNPDMDDKEIDYEGIRSGRVMMLQVLRDVALGEPEQSRTYYEGFKQRAAKQ